MITNSIKWPCYPDHICLLWTPEHSSTAPTPGGTAGSSLSTDTPDYSPGHRYRADTLRQRIVQNEIWCESERMSGCVRGETLTLLTAVSRVTRWTAAVSADVVTGSAVWTCAQLGAVHSERSGQAGWKRWTLTSCYSFIKTGVMSWTFSTEYSSCSPNPSITFIITQLPPHPLVYSFSSYGQSLTFCTKANVANWNCYSESQRIRRFYNTHTQIISTFKVCCNVLLMFCEGETHLNIYWYMNSAGE